MREIELLDNLKGIVALGRIAFDNLLKTYFLIYSIKINPKPQFLHGALIEFTGNVPWILVCYHPSRQNTQTGRLTIEMFNLIWYRAKSLIV